MLRLVILLFFLSSLASALPADVVKNLTKQLFETNAYDNTLRPANDQMSPTDLKVSFQQAGRTGGKTYHHGLPNAGMAGRVPHVGPNVISGAPYNNSTKQSVEARLCFEERLY